MRRFVRDRIAAALERAKPALEQYVSERLAYPEGFRHVFPRPVVMIREIRELRVIPLAKADLPVVRVEAVVKAWRFARERRVQDHWGPGMLDINVQVTAMAPWRPTGVTRWSPICRPQSVVGRHGTIACGDGGLFQDPRSSLQSRARQGTRAHTHAPTPPVDIEAIIERAGVPVVERALPDGVRATIGDVAGRRAIILNRHYRISSPRERRCVLAEELGHVLLGHKLVNSTVPGKPAIGLLEDQRLIYECEARTFAAELLMPFAEVSRRWFAFVIRSRTDGVELG